MGRIYAKEVRSFVGHNGVVSSVAVSGDDKWLVTGGDDTAARLWEISSGKQIRTFGGHEGWINFVALNGDGKWLLTGAGRSCRLWEVSNGNELRRFDTGPILGKAAVLGGDGKGLVVGRMGDDVADLFDISSGKRIRHFKLQAPAVLPWP